MPGVDQPLDGPVPLEAHHETAMFDCGVPVLNEYLHRYAIQNQLANAARTYVATRGFRVIGFYTLAFGSIEHTHASPRIKRGLARHPISVMLLGRLAVDLPEHGQGIGKGLLRDAIVRTIKASEIAGLRAIVVHAKDDAARKFYLNADFEPSATDPNHLMLLIKDAKAMLANSR